MQLGTRWSVGRPPPDRIPAAMSEAIARVERDLAGIDGLDASSWRWTLTWLEGKPVAELDDGTVVRWDAATGSAEVSAPEE